MTLRHNDIPECIRVNDINLDMPGVREIDSSVVLGVQEHRVLFHTGVRGSYTGESPSRAGQTRALGPIVLVRADPGRRIQVTVFGHGFLVPSVVEQVLHAMDDDQIRGHVYKDFRDFIPGGFGFSEVKIDYDASTPPIDHRPFVGQLVVHPHWGKGRVVSGANDPHDMRVLFGTGQGAHEETVDASNLEPVAELDNRWLFTFGQVLGDHVLVRVRAGNPGSRGHCGDLMMSELEARQLRLVVEKAGADVESLPPRAPNLCRFCGEKPVVNDYDQSCGGPGCITF